MTLLDADYPRVRVGAIIVTYNSAADLPGLLGSLDRSTIPVRAIVVDNGSSDQTVDVAAKYSAVRVIATGVNAGYSAGINVGRAEIHENQAVAILNPDLVMEEHALEQMLAELEDPTIGIVAPQLRNPDGSRFDSLRREPSVLSAIGDAIFSSRWPSRPAVLAETLRREADYASARDVAWAGGAALLISAPCNQAVGPWDSDTYFMYAEETDYARRCRDAGLRVRYLPSAVAWHMGGGSGQSPPLVALMSVNRIRYFERLHGRAETFLFQCATALHHLLRLRDVRHRTALRYLFSRRSWSQLPASESTTQRVEA